MKLFNRQDLDFFLPSSFKGLDKKYILKCVFDKAIQENWKPTTGDIIVGYTGNIFVISSFDNLVDSLGGKVYYYGGGSCNRIGGNVLDSTYSYTANESGIYYHPINGEEVNSYHSKICDFRFVPYPHELL